MKRKPAGRTSFARVKVTNKNKYEVNVNRKLGGTLTSGSGSIFSDGDIRLPGWLVEHKFRAQDTVVLPYKYFTKIKEQALLRKGLLPALVVTNKRSDDCVILEREDLVERTRLVPTIVASVPKRNTIKVDSKQLTLSVGEQLHCVDLGIKDLIMISLADFKRILSEGTNGQEERRGNPQGLCSQPTA